MSDAPQYRAYSAASGRVEFTSTGKNGDGGYRMSFDSHPIGESSDLEALAERLNAHLGRDPGDTVYLVDADQILVRTLRCDQHVAAVDELYSLLERQGRWHVIAWTLFIFCLISFVASAAIGTPVLGLAVFAFTAAIFLIIALLRVQNELESAIVAFVILILIWLILPAVRQAHDRHQEATQDAPSGAAQPSALQSE